jgi:uncharacterized protein
MESEYISWMDRYYLEFPNRVAPDEEGEEDRLVQQKGREHEEEFLQAVRDSGRDVLDLSAADGRREATLNAMRSGQDVIYQGELRREEFAGFPDFLVRVDGHSALGAWHYEVWDTKLARHPKPYFLIQLCCYADMLEAVQERRPREVQVVLGTKELRRFRTDDFFYFYRALKSAFLELQRNFDPEQPPDIPGLKDLGRWTSHAARILEERDDLSVVANIRGSQIRRLKTAGIWTAAQLAASDGIRVPRVNAATLDRLRRQARLQIASRGAERPRYELLTPDGSRPNLGLAALPPASPSDIFFDMEGFPLLEEGLEYLFGVVHLEEGRPVFRDWWAHNHREEKAAFEGFVRWAYERWKKDPTLHIYHYAAYEVTALRRLMGRYGTCEDEVDELLRHGVFVDLYAIVRQSLLIGEPAYSLKNVEKLYQEKRQGEVTTAGESMVFYQRWLVDQDGADCTTSATLRKIRAYNQEDCESTGKLAVWLRTLQAEAGVKPRTEADTAGEDAEEEVSAEPSSRAILSRELLAEIPEDRHTDSERWRVHELLAWLLEFHRREAKPVWWRMFDRHEMTEQELIDDPDCLGGLARTRRAPVPVKRSVCYEYRFDPHQETKFREEDGCIFAHDLDCKATVETIDFESGLVILKLGPKYGKPPDRLSLIPDEYVSPKPIADSIERVIVRWREMGKLPPALEDFLFRRRPRLRGNPSGPIIPPGMDLLAGAVSAARALDRSALCIQGPPGSGKTYTAAHMLVALLGEGKRVGIASNSHRAICLLTGETAKVAANQKVKFYGVKIGGDEDEGSNIHPCIDWARGAKDVFGCGKSPQLVGGTAWAFSNENADGELDYLFVDEAGQVSVANLVGMAPSTANIVLIGDQMQLSQPIQGSHPGESGMSTLDYLLQDQRTIPDDFGIFLARTWRLHPLICSFISGAVYDDRLHSEPITAARVVRFARSAREWIRKEAGLLYVPVPHEGNIYESEEEAEQAVQLIDELLKQHVVTESGSERALTRADILVVAPYNLQVRLLTSRLSEIRVGTVDKFQGQQAPVVIFSMCASSGDASARGIEFLFCRNRLNVAISRAQTLAVVVGHPSLVRTPCSTIEQMQLVNVYCRAVEEGAAVMRQASA